MSAADPVNAGDCCASCDTHAHDAGTAAADTRKRRQLTSVAAGGVSIGAGALLAWMGYQAASLVCFLVTIALSVEGPARRARSALGTRALDINVLMLIAVAGALVLGEWFEAAAVVWLFGVAQWLEARSMDRARHAIRSLMTQAPTSATLRRGTTLVQVPVADVRVGDIVVVRPGERVPVDGTVLDGESAVDQSPVTGESFPAEKAPGDEVFSGTINGTSALEVEASRVADDSTLARIIHLVEHAQSQRAPVQTFVDRFARRYTPAVVILAVFVAVVPPLVMAGASGWTQAFGVWSYRALALLVVACPCALVISTPVAFVSALTAAARQGVLIKGGAHLERLGTIRCVAFDKTGTLTHGRITVTDVLGVGGTTSDGVLAVAAALESRSEHPIGRAIVNRARDEGLAVAPGGAFRALPGLGAEATVAQAPALVGSHRLFEDRRLCTPALHACVEELESRGATPVLVSHDGAALGAIGLADAMRNDGKDAVERLRGHGVARVALLTGDLPARARTALTGAGLDEAHAELMPGDKVRAIARLREAHGPVAMVGDGINDAPALAAADVGIAMGVAGTDVALETADVVLMSDDLTKLPYALRLGRATRRNIHQNVTIALSLKVLFVVLAAAGLATMWMAIVADTGASLLVTANSLRLLRAK
jgi:Cd2+/Zn2+-exporting ATPase